MLNLKNRRYIANRLCPDIRGQDQNIICIIGDEGLTDKLGMRPALVSRIV
jgi:hypothetical protein